MSISQSCVPEEEMVDERQQESLNRGKGRKNAGKDRGTKQKKSVEGSKREIEIKKQ